MTAFRPMLPTVAMDCPSIACGMHDRGAHRVVAPFANGARQAA
jgi:hypothetical protein